MFDVSLKSEIKKILRIVFLQQRRPGRLIISLDIVDQCGNLKYQSKIIPITSLISTNGDRLIALP